MEWTKEKLLNTCVTMKSVAHAVRIVEFYKSFGWMEEVNIKDAKNHFKRKDVGMYIGVDSLQNTKYCHSWWPYVLPKYVNEIKLPSRPRRKFPREMMVSDNNLRWNKRIVVAKAKTKWPVIALKINFDLEDEFIEYRSWKYAKELNQKINSLKK